jgi:hypothetical protein
MSTEREEAPPASGVMPKKPAPKPKLVECAWVEEGMTVWLLWHRPLGSALRCTVTTAAGDHARVVNERAGVDRWASLRSLYVQEGDVHSFYPSPAPRL